MPYTMDMRKPFIIAAAALALFLATPAVASYAAPNHDRAAGTGVLGQFGDPTVDVDAVATRTGVTGGFTIVYPDGTVVGGLATCLSVDGHTAYVTGRIVRATGPRQSTNNWLPGYYLVIGVQDNGEPGTAGPDLLNFSAGFAADPGCGPNSAANPTLSIVDGDYRVVDAA
jgi:hypothetical protein